MILFTHPSDESDEMPLTLKTPHPHVQNQLFRILKMLGLSGHAHRSVLSLSQQRAFNTVTHTHRRTQCFLGSCRALDSSSQLTCLFDWWQLLDSFALEPFVGSKVTVGVFDSAPPDPF